ncbi:MAG: hypothetical protein AAGD33_13660 [Actinomycetota bacterium]
MNPVLHHDLSHSHVDVELDERRRLAAQRRLRRRLGRRRRLRQAGG